MPYLQPDMHELPFASGSDTSEAAARKASAYVGKQGRDVLAFLTWFGASGCTQKEASAELCIGRPSLAARFHALEQRGEIRKTTARRDGCVVYEVT